MIASDDRGHDANFVTRCRWLLRPGQRPLSDVRLTVERGVVVDTCPVPPDERALIEPIAIAPQLVNAHTHLEFSSLNNPLAPSQPFPDWIRSVIRYRIEHPETNEIQLSIDAGLTESRRAGVGLVGEISTCDSGRRTLGRQNDISVISFREYIGFGPDAAADRISELRAERVEEVPSSDVVTEGLSPHAPYSVHPLLFEAIVDEATRRNCPIAMHLGETQDELELLARRSGRFRDFLEAMNLWDETVLGDYRSLRPYLEAISRCRHALAVHGNYLEADDIHFLGQNPHIGVVYCPRTHAYFGHPEHPVERLHQAGATVVLGTDSRASNPDLSIWRELQFMAGRCVRPIWEELERVTTMSARALGKEPQDYAIEVGRPARLTSISCRCETQAGLHEALTSADSFVIAKA